MGTHPIFESDFDCPTENIFKPKTSKSKTIFSTEGFLNEMII